jgi:hypothetical protein
MNAAFLAADGRQALRDAHAGLAAAQAAVDAGEAALTRAGEHLTEVKADLVAAESADLEAAHECAGELRTRSALADGSLSALVEQGAQLARIRSHVRVAEIASEDAQIRLNTSRREFEAAKRTVDAARMAVLLSEAEALGELIATKTTELTALHARLGGRYDAVAKRLPNTISKRLQIAFYDVDDGPCGLSGHPAKRALLACAEEWSRFFDELAINPDATLDF